ncbi:hypothetical protein [Flavobacterium sp. GP15]|uniref:hypothetical protein n=1 Tax=Flavobacterium sp. GP15 TaxID=2758567 RepID=UPI00165D7C92|nr:hypothetical protein [Flavobacterium sp. GP15]
MKNQIDLEFISSKKYQKELYQLRLKSYLDKCEDFEEIDFINDEVKYFDGCYNAVDENYYNSQMILWYELKEDIGEEKYFDYEPEYDLLTGRYISNNRNNEARLQKTFSLILKYLEEKRTIFSSHLEQQSKSFKIDEKYKTQNLFKVGLLFATGKMQKYFTIIEKENTIINMGYSAPKIAKELENLSFEKFILASINNYSKENPNGNKNIFNSREMMLKIIEECDSLGKTVNPYFLNRLPME